MLKGTKYKWVEKINLFMIETLNPLHPKINIHILHTALYTYPKVLTRRICLPIKSFFWEKFDTSHSWGHSFILITLTCDSGVVL